MYSFFKRFIDIVGSSTILILLSPLFVIISIFIRLDSRGPCFFRQDRIGKNLRLFTMLKFRSMVDSKASMGQFEEQQTKEESRRNYLTTSKNDARITRVGKVLRRTHLDEIPQLTNVFLGDMSLIGPRPDVPVQEVDYSSRQWRRRHMKKPGITGLAQVYTNHAKMTPRLRIALDIKYTKCCSFKMDIYIVGKTIAKLFSEKSF